MRIYAGDVNQSFKDQIPTSVEWVHPWLKARPDDPSLTRFSSGILGCGLRNLARGSPRLHDRTRDLFFSDSRASSLVSQIGFATSMDEINWSRDPSNAILSAGSPTLTAVNLYTNSESMGESNHHLLAAANRTFAFTEKLTFVRTNG